MQSTDLHTRNMKPPCSLVCRQETCKKLQALIDKIDEERYDVAAKVQKGDVEVKM